MRLRRWRRVLTVRLPLSPPQLDQKESLVDVFLRLEEEEEEEEEEGEEEGALTAAARMARSRRCFVR